MGRRLPRDPRASLRMRQLRRRLSGAGEGVRRIDQRAGSLAVGARLARHAGSDAQRGAGAMREILDSFGRDADPNDFVVAADALEEAGDRRLLASALDRAFGLAPHRPELRARLIAVLDELATEVHGMRFRYVPAGTFLMGSEHGDPDERPVHPVRLDGFWICDAP